MLFVKENKNCTRTYRNEHFSHYTRVSNSLNSFYIKNTTTLNEFCIPLKKIERRKRDLLIGEIKLELLKNANQEISKEMGRLMVVELQGIREKIREQQVIRRIEFVFENEITEAIKRSDKIAMQEFSTVIELNLKTINKIIDVEYEEADSIEGISEKIIRLLDEEMKGENWYVLMALQNQQLLYEISKLKARWGKLINKIDYTSDMNIMIKRREKKRREKIEGEKSIIKEVEERVFSEVLEMSKNKIKSDRRVAGEKINFTEKSELARDIKEILLLKREEINEVILKLSEKGKTKEIKESKNRASSLTMGVCKIIIKRAIKSNWYYGLIRKWDRRINKKRALHFRCNIRNKKRKSKRKEREEKEKKKHKDERRKWDWYIIRNGGLSGVNLIKDTSKEQFLLYLAKTYYVD